MIAAETPARPPSSGGTGCAAPGSPDRKGSCPQRSATRTGSGGSSRTRRAPGCRSTTLAEIDAFVRPTGPVGAYIAEIFEAYYDDHFARSKVIWDVGEVAWLVDPVRTPSALVHSPVLTSEGPGATTRGGT